MKIAIIGSAPSSIRLAPYSDPTWKIWGCSPGVYYIAARTDAWFELHRWEPPAVGKPDAQKPWFSPEYVQWMSRHPNVWMHAAVPEIPGSRPLPVDDLLSKYGSYFFTSTIAWMLACAIEDILEQRNLRAAAAKEAEASVECQWRPVDGEAIAPDMIGLWGVDMAANEEYGYQRAGCQHFIDLATMLGIQVIVPPESDLLRPMPLYGIDESSHWMIKLTERKRELDGRLAQARQALEQAKQAVAFLEGAVDDMNYHMQTWGGDRDGFGVSPDILAQSPYIRQVLQREAEAKHPLVVVQPGSPTMGDGPA